MVYAYKDQLKKGFIEPLDKDFSKVMGELYEFSEIQAKSGSFYSEVELILDETLREFDYVNKHITQGLEEEQVLTPGKSIGDIYMNDNGDILVPDEYGRIIHKNGSKQHSLMLKLLSNPNKRLYFRSNDAQLDFSADEAKNIGVISRNINRESRLIRLLYDRERGESITALRWNLISYEDPDQIREKFIENISKSEILPQKFIDKLEYYLNQNDNIDNLSISESEINLSEDWREILGFRKSYDNGFVSVYHRSKTDPEKQEPSKIVYKTQDGKLINFTNRQISVLFPLLESRSSNIEDFLALGTYDYVQQITYLNKKLLPTPFQIVERDGRYMLSERAA